MVTMKDVAKEAGVSRPTVSLILNRQDSKVRISEATRVQVLEVAERLGYRRNVLATSMKTGRTNIIAFVGGLVEEYVMRIIEGINVSLINNGYLLKMMGQKYDEDISGVARQCVEQMVDGVICRSMSEENLEIIRKELAPHNIPIVLVDNSFSHDWCPRVVSDDLAGARLAVEHLAKLGHSRIGHVTISMHTGFVSLRKAGYEQGMTAAELELDEANFAYLPGYLEQTSEMYDELDRFYQEYRPTAVFCSTDPIAMKVLQWAYQRKIAIPEQLSVVGFADLGYAELAAPTLTTVAQPFELMGERAGVKVLNMIKNSSAEEDEALAVKLIERESTAPLH